MIYNNIYEGLYSKCKINKKIETPKYMDITGNILEDTASFLDSTGKKPMLMGKKWNIC